LLSAAATGASFKAAEVSEWEIERDVIWGNKRSTRVYEHRDCHVTALSTAGLEGLGISNTQTSSAFRPVRPANSNSDLPACIRQDTVPKVTPSIQALLRIVK